MHNSRGVTFNLSCLVEDKKKELMARDSALTALEAHRLAIDAIVNKNPDIVKLYRVDAQK